MSNLENSFVTRINSLEEKRDLDGLKKELKLYANRPEERFYISSALSFLLNKTITQVQDLLI